jgi:hypothetical protein
VSIGITPALTDGDPWQRANLVVLPHCFELMVRTGSAGLASFCARATTARGK